MLFVPLFLVGGVAYASVEGEITFQTSIENKHFQLMLPIPHGLIPYNSNIELFEDNIPIEITYKALTLWPESENSKYVRLMLIDAKIGRAHV